MSSFNPGPGGDLGATEITTTGKGTFGNVAVSESAAPAAPADGAGGILYCKADGKIYWISNELAETDLTSGGGGGLTDEQLQDKVGAMFSGNTETLITATYQDGDGTIDLVVNNDLSAYDNSSSGFITATLTDEQLQDKTGAMFTSNTETGITATYQDADGTIDLVVSDLTVAGDSGSTGMTPGDTLTIAGGTNCTTAMSGDTLTVNATGGSDTYTLIERGYAYMGFPHRKYLHYYPGTSTTYESSREWSKYLAGWGHSQATSIDTTPEEALAYWACFIVPAACTVTSAIAWYKADQTQSTYVSILKADMSSANDSAGNITWTEMKKATSSGNTSGRSHQVSLTSLSNNTLAAGDMIAVALDGNQTSNTSWSAQNCFFEISIKVTPS